MRTFLCSFLHEIVLRSILLCWEALGQWKYIAMLKSPKECRQNMGSLFWSYVDLQVQETKSFHSTGGSVNLSFRFCVMLFHFDLLVWMNLKTEWNCQNHTFWWISDETYEKQVPFPGLSHKSISRRPLTSLVPRGPGESPMRLTSLQTNFHISEDALSSPFPYYLLSSCRKSSILRLFLFHRSPRNCQLASHLLPTFSLGIQLASVFMALTS